MKINKDVLLFDLDGTLTDSADGIINSIKHRLLTSTTSVDFIQPLP